MRTPEPVYGTSPARVDRLLTRLRAMHSGWSAHSSYDNGYRDGIRTAALAVKEELNTNLIQTLSGAPVPVCSECNRGYS